MKTPLALQPFERLRTTPWWLLPLILLLALGAALRLVNLDAPPLDFHSTRQLRNSLVARAVYYDHLPYADPQKRALADSFERAVGQYEPPITESIVGFTFLLTGGESFAVPRLYGTIYWLLAAIALFDLERRIFPPAAGLVSLAYILVLPFAVQASRSFQPDPLMTASFVAGVCFLYRWMEELTPASEKAPGAKEAGWKWAILAALFLGFAVLVKIVIVFLVIGVAIPAVLLTKGRLFWRSRQAWAMAALMALPALAYYVLGHPGRSSEYFFSWTVALVKLITSPHFYADWLGFVGSLFGLTTLFLSLAGTLLAPPRLRWLLIGLWVGYVVYGLVLPFQMYTHSYYHIQLIPVVALGLAPVVEAVAVRASALSRGWKAVLAGVVVVLIGYQSWAARSVLVAEDFSHVPATWQAIGEAIPANAEVLALTQDYGYDLMYWGWRKVALWPLSTDLAEVKNGDRDLAARFTDLTMGRDYFLVTAFGQLNKQPGLKKVLDGYSIAAQGDGYILYDLHGPK
jgi:4-amino-4-deoxy-L-arabinose transferase-like glycosyltransferase